MTSLDYNHALFTSEFVNELESRGFYLKKPFNDGVKGDRFYKLGEKKNKAFGRYRYFSASESKSGNPMIMWTLFSVVDKTTGKAICSAETNYFWFKPQDGGSGTKPKFDEEAYRKRIKEREEQEQQLQTKLRAQAYQEYLELSKGSSDPNLHPYIQRKNVFAPAGVIVASKSMKIESYYNRFKQAENEKTFYVINKGDLIIPAKNIDGQFVTYQCIRADGSKRQRIDISTVGAFFPIGGLDEHTKRVFLCEGFATTVSLYDAIKSPVLACYDVNNIGVVAEQLINRYPELEVISATDNDRQKSTKVGLLKGFEYAWRYDIPFIFPRFSENDDKSLSDWNDLSSIMGKDRISENIEKQIEYFKTKGRVVSIEQACYAFGISMDELSSFAESQKSKHPNLFSALIRDQLT